MELLHTLGRHAPADAEEAFDLRRILDFVGRHADPFDRRRSEGHLTASAFVVSGDGEKVLLLRHRKLERWLQPGGHAEPGETVGEVVALREAREETGLQDLRLHPEAPRPLDVDVHDIPAREEEPAHEHLDLRYLFVTGGTASLALRADEKDAVRWFAWDELADLDLDPGLRRALGKVRAFWT